MSSSVLCLNYSYSNHIRPNIATRYSVFGPISKHHIRYSTIINIISGVFRVAKILLQEPLSKKQWSLHDISVLTAAIKHCCLRTLSKHTTSYTWRHQRVKPWWWASGRWLSHQSEEQPSCSVYQTLYESLGRSEQTSHTAALTNTYICTWCGKALDLSSIGRVFYTNRDKAA